MPKGKPTGVMCAICSQPILSGQMTSGVLHSEAPPLTPDGTRASDEKYYEGHYLCVMQALGAEETLKATHDGRLPFIDPSILVDGCLPDGWTPPHYVDLGAIQAERLGRPPGVGAIG